MMKHKAASAEQLDLLGRPDSLATLALLHDQGWLTAERQVVDGFFEEDTSHLAAVVLRKQAHFGGLAGLLQVVILLILLACALLTVSLTRTSATGAMSLTLLVPWAVFGVAAALIIRAHPGYLELLGKKRQRTK